MFVAQQRAAFSTFAYDFFDASGILVGALTWPDYPVASNSRLKNLVPKSFSTKIELDYAGKKYTITFEYLIREWFNDIRFSLMDGDEMLALAEVKRSKKRFQRSAISLIQPFAGRVVCHRSFFTLRYELIKADWTGDASVGQIAQAAKLSIKRKLTINLPDSICAPIQFFIFFLVCNHAVR